MDFLYDYPLIGMFLAGLVLGLCFVIPIIKNSTLQIPGGLYIALAVITLALGVFCLFNIFQLLISLLFDGLFRGMLLGLVGFLIGLAILYVPITMATRERKGETTVIGQIISKVEGHNAAYVVLCVDGVALLTQPSSEGFAPARDIACDSQQELEGYSSLSQCTSFSDYIAKDFVSFSQWSMENLTEQTMDLFHQRLSAKLSGYNAQQCCRYATYANPLYSTPTRVLIDKYYLYTL